MKKETRFIKIYSQGAGSKEIWVDKQTRIIRFLKILPF